MSPLQRVVAVTPLAILVLCLGHIFSNAVRTIPAGSAVKFIKGLAIRFGVPNRIITDNGS